MTGMGGQSSPRPKMVWEPLEHARTAIYLMSLFQQRMRAPGRDFLPRVPSSFDAPPRFPLCRQVLRLCEMRPMERL